MPSKVATFRYCRMCEMQWDVQLNEEWCIARLSFVRDIFFMFIPLAVMIV